MNTFKTIVAAALVAFSVPAFAQSHCKGLGEQVCSPAKACRWMPARAAGEKSPRTGKEYTNSAKAHCRLDVKKAGEIASKQ
jgi:hypothetical protein